MTDPRHAVFSLAARLKIADREREVARQRLVTAIRLAADPGGLTVAQIATLSGYSRQHVHRLLADRPTP